jgi:hypothetical protein
MWEGCVLIRMRHVCVGKDREYAFRPRLSYSPSLVFGLVTASRFGVLAKHRSGVRILPDVTNMKARTLVRDHHILVRREGFEPS